MISVMVGQYDCEHSSPVEKNVPQAFILPSRCRDGAVSLGIETTNCLLQCAPEVTLGICFHLFSSFKLLLCSIPQLRFLSRKPFSVGGDQTLLRFYKKIYHKIMLHSFLRILNGYAIILN